MTLLYDPGIHIPRSEEDFAWSSWLLSWSHGPWYLPELEPGETMYLVDAAAQRIVWEARVTHMYAVPYEAIGDLEREIRRRWGLSVVTTNMVRGGFSIGWRAEPVAHLDRGPLDLPGWTGDRADAELALTGWQFTDSQPEAFRRRWALPDPLPRPRPLLPRSGWFGPDAGQQHRPR